jgi:hypothetical protein
MPGQIKITFKNFTYMDFSTAKKVKLPGKKSSLPGEETLLRGGVSALAEISSRKKMWKSALDIASPPTGVLSILGSIPGVKIRSGKPDFTLAVGGSMAAGGGAMNVASGAGVYFWNKSPTGEVGLYGSISIGAVTNLGVSIGDSLAYMFGKPGDVLTGDCITVSIDVGIDVVTLTGSLILSAPPVSLWPPAITGAWTPEVIGIGFGLSVGMSALPADISVMPGRTWIKPVT